MKIILKIFLFFILLLCPLQADAYIPAQYDLSHKTAICAPKHFEKDFIKNNFNTLSISLNKTEEAYNLINSKINNLSSGTSEYLFFENKKQFTNDNFYFENFLDKKSKNIISLLLFQIQPNAP